MHQLSIALKNKGYQVTGSDDEIFEPSRSNLEKAGILPQEMGWNEGRITPDIDAVILGMHAREDNPELKKAQEFGLNIYSFPEYIFRESMDKIRVAVGGSHGKTSTTAMIMHVMQQAKMDFDYLVGARLEGFDQSVKITDAPLIICEADEYPASTIERRPKFHFLYPQIAIITGIAWDHINVFPTFEFYLEQFVIFINKIEKDGVLIYNESDTVLSKLVDEHKRTDIRYIPYNLPHYTIENGITNVSIGEEEVSLQVFGVHNLLNMQAAYYVCKELKMNDVTFARAIKNFAGAAKRLELISLDENRNVFRDFAHAPSKVKASIDAVKEQFPDRKLVAVLELHTFSSLNANFMSEYKGAMEKADVAVVFYSNHAIEIKRLSPLAEEDVQRGFEKEGLHVITDKNKLIELLKGVNTEPANFLFMSSGTYEGMDILNTLNNG